MKGYFKTAICEHCGADYGLHKHDTAQCPKNGIEENRFDKLNNRFFPQQWEETTFEDSGIAKLNRAAPDLYDALVHAKEVIRIWHGINFKDEKQEQEAWDIYNSSAPEMNPINVALELVKPQV